MYVRRNWFVSLLARWGFFFRVTFSHLFLSWFLRPAAAMRWTKDHDLILLKEILLFEPYSQKRGSPERGRVWEQIAESLNGQREDKILFEVSQRSVRDRFNALKNNCQATKGGRMCFWYFAWNFWSWWVFGGHNREVQRKTWKSKKGEWGKKERATKDALKAAEMRKRSLENFTESRNRNNEEIIPKRARNNSNDTISYLTAKYESDGK